MKVGVIGLGYVGLPLVVAFAEAGDDVVALDVDPLKISAVSAGDSYIEDIPSERLQAVLPKIRATYRYADLAKADAVIICVPTPLTENREPDLGPLDAAAKSLAQVLQPGQLIVLESTTYPGTTRERVMPLLESSGLRVGTDINLAFSPERVDPGRTDYSAAQHAQGGRRHHAGLPGSAPTICTAACAITSSGSRRPRPRS